YVAVIETFEGSAEPAVPDEDSYAECPEQNDREHIRAPDERIAELLHNPGPAFGHRPGPALDVRIDIRASPGKLRIREQRGHVAVRGDLLEHGDQRFEHDIITHVVAP